jgi:DNA-binding NarL/FixJ family response regulator
VPERWIPGEGGPGLRSIARRSLEHVAESEKVSYLCSMVPTVVKAVFAHDGRTNGMKKIKILLVEDNRILRDGLKAIIDKEADLKVVATSEGNHDTLQQARSLKPQVVLVDLGLRNENGLRVVATLTKELPQTKVIGMGLIPSQLDVVEFVRAGAAGFILRDATIGDVLGTIRAVVRGKKILPPVLMGSLFTHVVNHARRKGEGKLPDGVRMTKREREIIALIADSLSNKEIAQRLSIEIYTVKSHVHNILEKLALRSRLEITAYFHNNDPL